MDSVNIANNSISRYLKKPRENTLFHRASLFYIFCLYVMPQYFGIQNAIFDLTIVRISIIILLVFIFCDYTRQGEFLKCFIEDKSSWVLLPYVIVLFYTMILRVDPKAFLNPFIEFLEMFLLIYTIKDDLGVDKTIKILIGFIYLLTILGILEIFMQVSPFSYLVTIRGIYTGRYIRGGHYRIMSSTNHSIGYGMLLVTALPFVGIDVDKKKYNIFKRPILLALVVTNVFATGSRSSLGVMLFELALMFIFSDREYLRKNLLIVVTYGTAFAILVFLLQGTAIGKFILLEITSLLDTLFGTQMSIKYGANIEALGQSASYRKLLKEVFHVSWLNPVLGIGRKRVFSSEINGLVVQSIDNFYIAEYIRYAYPGMLSFIAFLAFMGYRMLKDIIITRSAIIRMVLIGSISYCIHLYIADSLQTFKYLYVLFALYVCCDKTPYVPPDPGKYFRKKESKYVRK